MTAPWRVRELFLFAYGLPYGAYPMAATAARLAQSNAFEAQYRLMPGSLGDTG
jgi:hypothetical protein